MDAQLAMLLNENEVIQKIVAFRQNKGENYNLRAELREAENHLEALLSILKEKSEEIEEAKQIIEMQKQELNFVKRDRNESIVKLQKLAEEFEQEKPIKRGKLESMASVSTVSSCGNCTETAEALDKERKRVIYLEDALVECKVKYAEKSSALMDLEDENAVLKFRLDVLKEKMRGGKLESQPNSLENTPKRMETDYNIYRTPKSPKKMHKQVNLNNLRQPSFDK